MPLHAPASAHWSGQAKQRMEYLSTVLTNNLRQDKQREEREAATASRHDAANEQERQALIQRLKKDAEKIKEADERKKKERVEVSPSPQSFDTQQEEGAASSSAVKPKKVIRHKARTPTKAPLPIRLAHAPVKTTRKLQADMSRVTKRDLPQRRHQVHLVLLRTLVTHHQVLPGNGPLPYSPKNYR